MDINTKMSCAAKHLVMIPTDRDISNCLEGYLKDISHCISLGLISSEDIALVIVEDGRKTTALLNEKYVDSISFEYDFRIMHFTPDVIDKFIAEICGNDHTLKKIFFKGDSNYGRIGNILSLIACAMKAEYIHRRDSDTSIYYKGNSSNSPLEAELLFFKSNVRHNSIVGSNYFLSSDIDTVIFNCNKKKISKLYELVGMNEKTISEKLSVNNTPSINSPVCEVVTDGIWPDVGNLAIKNLFRSCSLPTNEATLGTDYFFMQIAELCSIPMYLHNQRILHVLSKDRRNVGRLLRYYKMLAKCVDYFSIYSMCTFNIEKKFNGSPAICEILERLAESSESLIDYRIERLEQYSKLFLSQGIELELLMYTSIKSEIPEIIISNTSSIFSHYYLQKRWELLTETAEISSVLKEFVVA